MSQQDELSQSDKAILKRAGEFYQAGLDQAKALITTAIENAGYPQNKKTDQK